jgi:hypothetical protein
MSRRLAVTALPLLLAVGCAQMPNGHGDAERDRAAMSPAERFATDIEAADQAMEGAIGRMDSFEHLAAREDSAITYAIGTNRNPQLLPSAGGVAEATGRVLAPSFAALGDYGHVLAQVAAGQPVQAKPSASGTELAEAAARALDQVRTSAGVTVSPEMREAGLRAIVTLADMPEQLTKNRGARPSLNQLVSEAQPHVKALTAMLQELLGETQQQGVRNAIRTRRLALDDAHTRFLNAVRTDRTAGPAERYAIFRSVSELREGDPAQGTLQQISTLLAALATAHDALDDGAADAEAKVLGFEAAVDRLATLTTLSRRAGQ